jgi:hypothetical protein
VRPLCREKLTDGFRRGFQVIVKLPARRSPNAKRPRGTWLVAEASHMQLGSLLRLLRSTRVVRLDRPSVALLLFESSDGTVCCAVGRLHETDRWCTTDEPQYGAIADTDGTVILCGDTRPGESRCTANPLTSNLHRLADGQLSDVNGVRVRRREGRAHVHDQDGRGRRPRLPCGRERL